MKDSFTEVEAKEIMNQYHARSSSRIHRWDKPEFTEITYYHGIRFKQTCSVCGSIRMTSLSHKMPFRYRKLYRIFSFWHIANSRIFYPEKYKETRCYENRASKHHHEDKNGKTRIGKKLSVTVEDLERKFRQEEENELKWALETERIEKQKLFLNQQIERNSVIIKKFPARLLKRGKVMNRLRRNLAIYRLHNYCDISDKRIAGIVGINVYRIRTIVGETFRLICMSDDSCVFRPIFYEMYEKGERIE